MGISSEEKHRLRTVAMGHELELSSGLIRPLLSQEAPVITDGLGVSCPGLWSTDGPVAPDRALPSLHPAAPVHEPLLLPLTSLWSCEHSPASASELPI